MKIRKGLFELEKTKIEWIKVVPRDDVSREEALKEAALLALLWNETVNVRFGMELKEVKPDDILDFLTRAEWASVVKED
jgi:hypothetical protein